MLCQEKNQAQDLLAREVVLQADWLNSCADCDMQGQVWRGDEVCDLEGDIGAMSLSSLSSQALPQPPASRKQPCTLKTSSKADAWEDTASLSLSHLFF